MTLKRIRGARSEAHTAKTGLGGGRGSATNEQAELDAAVRLLAELLRTLARFVRARLGRAVADRFDQLARHAHDDELVRDADRAALRELHVVQLVAAGVG